uniref:G-protein coupled receptors family 1 profile domain-containing protein n=1 Tax=Petromyzon marinus TaxID=7757 RepID=S4RR62_PETMA
MTEQGEQAAGMLPEHCKFLPQGSNAGMIGFYSTLLVLGVAGNGLACWRVLGPASRDLKSAPAVFGLNLMAAHAVLLLSLPFRIVHYARQRSWPFGTGFCSAVSALLYVHMYVSVLLFVCLCVYRFVQLWRRHGDSGAGGGGGGGAWRSPPRWYLEIIGTNTTRDAARKESVCFEYSGRVEEPYVLRVNVALTALYAIACVAFVVGFCLLGRRLRRGAGGRRPGTSGPASVEMRALLKLLWMFAAFVVCYGPYHATRLPYVAAQADASGAGCEGRHRWYMLNEMCLQVTALSTCLDPLVFFI